MSIVYVAGFVDVVNYPKSDKSLLLNPEQIAKCLPINNPIPLNIEHLCDAEVGWTLGLHQVDYGLFCIGAITSLNFLNLLEKLFINSSVAQIRDKNVSPQPKLEMLHTWLPELSLSSMHPDLISKNIEPCQTFQHVALCAMGKRRGTIAVYGHDVPWIISKFISLNEYEKDKLVQLYNSVDTSNLELPNFNIQPEVLMAKAIDAGFIKYRLDILKADRGVADVKNALYLKASAQELDSQFLSDTDNKLLDTEKSAAQLVTTAINMNQSTSQPMGHQTDELISIPKSTFISMLQANIDSGKQNNPRQTESFQNELKHIQYQTPYPIMGNIYYPHPSQASTAMTPYANSGLYQPDFQIRHHNTPINTWVGNYAVDEGCGHFAHGQYIPAKYPSRPGKRKRDSDYFDGPIFPGEEINLYRDFANITKNISEIQNEIKELKNTAMGQKQEFVPSSQNWLYMQPSNGQHLNYPVIPPSSIAPPTMLGFQPAHQIPYYNFNNNTSSPDAHIQTPVQFHQITTQNPYTPPPIPPKIIQPTTLFTNSQTPQTQQQQPTTSQETETENKQAPKEHQKQKNEKKVMHVDASFKRDNTNQLQKMFCEEILNKQ